MSIVIVYEARHVLTGEDAGDIAITAAEGGINYWATVDQYQWTRWQDIWTGDPKPISDGFVFYTIAGIVEADLDDLRDICLQYDHDMELAVTPRLIARGIAKYLQGVPGNFEGRTFADMDDFGAMDAAEADCVIQLGAFGHLVFG